MTLRFATLFWRLVVRPWGLRPLMPLLNICGVALGVAVFLAIQMANDGALRSFRNAVGLVAGKAHLEVRGRLPEDLFPKVAALPGVAEATPLVEGIATRPDLPGEYFRILGVDPFTGGSLRVFDLENPGGGALDLEAWLREPGILASATNLPDRFPVLANGARVELRRGFALRSDDALVSNDPRTAAMDIGWAQQLLGLNGYLTSIQISARDPLDLQPLVEALRAVCPPDAIVAPPGRRGAETEVMLAAFQLNLTALSLVSMVVGVFLIYNSLSAAVVRRRPEIAILRAGGASRSGILLVFLAEGLAAGLLGSLLGIALATPLAGFLAAPVQQTISSLYALVSIARPSLGLWQVVVALVIGLGASLVAAWCPAREASRCDPALALRPGSLMDSFPLGTRAWAPMGVLSLAVSAVFSWGALHGGGRFLGFAAVAFLIGGFSLLVPWVVERTALHIRGPGWMARLAAQHLLRSLHRNAVTIASLSIAIAMTVSVSVMIHSFRASVNNWLSHTLVADLFIAPAANEIAGLQAFLPGEAVEWVKMRPEVESVGTFREIRVPWKDQTATLAVLDGEARGQLAFVSGRDDAGREFRDEGAAAVSESFATRHGIQPGDTLEFLSPKGPVVFPVAGVVKDFTRDSGLVMIARKRFDEFWNEPGIHSLSIELREGCAAEALAEAFRARFGRGGEFSIYTNGQLRMRVLEIFDQTFAVTSVLRAIAVVVAVAGVLLSLSTLVIEREREIGILRSQGASRSQVRGLFLTEAGLIGAYSCLVGLACGAAMAMILTWVINKAFFGWTIDLRYPWAVLAATPLWIVPAALAAAWWPASRASGIPPARALRFE